MYLKFAGGFQMQDPIDEVSDNETFGPLLVNLIFLNHLVPLDNKYGGQVLFF